MGSAQDDYQEMERAAVERAAKAKFTEKIKQNGDELAKQDAIIANEKKDEAQRRKQCPVYSGVLRYFPNALMEVAHCSWLGSQQHQPGEPMRWDRDKSGDELDAHIRHLMDMDDLLEKDSDGSYHLAKAIWRLCAIMEKELEKKA